MTDIPERQLPPLPEPTRLPGVLLDLIGEYGMSRIDKNSDLERMHKWQSVIVAIKQYAADHGQQCAEAATAAERARWQSELSVIYRTLLLETQAHKRSHEEVLRLAERLRRYEPGKPMHLNATRKD